MTPEQIIDISYTIEEGMPTYMAPWHPLVSIKQMGRFGLEGRESRELTLGTHTGTHVDAPKHFIRGGKSIDQIPLSVFVGDVTIIDFTQFGAGDAITEQELRGNKFLPRVIFKFDWFKNWNEIQYYENWPYFTRQAAQFLVDQGVRLVGLDTPSPDNWQDGRKAEVDSPIHQILLSHEVILLEYLNLTDVQALDGWTLLAQPLKIRDSDGAPVRALLVK